MSSLTPLVFTREYQAYRAANTAIPFPDSRLLAAVRFWSRYPDALASDSYSSFWLEDLPSLLAIDTRALDDFHPDELAEIATFIAGLDPAHLTSPLAAASLREQAARKWLYVGETARALKCLKNAEFGMRIAELELLIPNSEISNSQSVDTTEIPRLLIRLFGDMEGEPALVRWLETFDADWRAIRESGHTNQATCVLVERDAGGKPIRGRLRTLEAHIEALPKGRDSDEVVFGHQLCTADDPQVRGAYAAVASLRLLTLGSNAEFGLRSAELKNSGQPIPHSAIRIPHSYFRARFTFANDNREPYGGDSLAFACFTAAYGDWWSKDLHRERRLVAAQVALTGALTSDGQAESVAENSLEQKIERVFFSPLSYVVVPQSNRAAAERMVAALHRKYPNRRLRIITAERASDLMSDGNITIPERVCFGEYAVRAAAKYSKSAKVQVPILILLVAIFGWLTVPKIRAVLDTRLAHIEPTRRGFEAKNQYGHTLWSKEYQIVELVNDPPRKLFDLDGDGQPEVLFYVAATEPAPDHAKIDVFSSDGTHRFRLDPVIRGQYPGDYETGDVHTPGMVEVVTVRGEPVIVTGANAQNPSRFHLRMWSARGDSLGWYVNAGVTAAQFIAFDVDSDGTEELVFPGYNIRMRAVCLFCLDAKGSYGVAPPYADPQYDLSHVSPGNQRHYMIFPRTDVTEVMGDRLYNSLRGIVDVTSSGFRLDVLEGSDQEESAEVRSWAVNYYIDSTLHLNRVDLDDAYKARREALVRADSLTSVSWTEYFESLRDTVTYWTPGGWRSERSLQKL